MWRKSEKSQADVDEDDLEDERSTRREKSKARPRRGAAPGEYLTVKVKDLFPHTDL